MFTGLRRWVAEVQPDVIAIDPLLAVAAGNLNHDAGMLATCRAITKLARAGEKLASVVILHHTLTGRAGASKASGYDRGSYGRGSKALNFWTRGQINIAAAHGKSNDRLVVSCGKNSDGQEFQPFGIRLDSETMKYELDPEFDHSDWKDEIGGAAKVKLNEKLTPEAVAEHVAELALSKKALVRALMEETGCGKSTAYNAIEAAEGKTIRRNTERTYELAE